MGWMNSQIWQKNWIVGTSYRKNHISKKGRIFIEQMEATPVLMYNGWRWKGDFVFIGGEQKWWL